MKEAKIKITDMGAGRLKAEMNNELTIAQVLIAMHQLSLEILNGRYKTIHNKMDIQARNIDADIKDLR